MSSGSLVRRVAQGSALAAFAAALLAALGTMGLASYLIQRAEDRRLEEAAVTFAVELDQDGVDLDAIKEVHRDESEELEHTGMLFAVYDSDGQLLVGDHRLRLPSSIGCANVNENTLRVCRAQSDRGLEAIVGAAHVTLLPVLAAAAIIAALVAAALAWIASIPISRHVIAPLTRLRSRIADLEVATLSSTHLGASDGVIEVDALRSTITEMISRVERALELAHRFAANAAHELRTPLTTARAELELVSNEMRDPVFRANVARAEQKLAELSTLVERLLILCLPERSEIDAYEAVSLRDLLEDTVEALPTEDRERVEVSDDDALVHGDGALLATMTANAVANGLKFGARVWTKLSVSGHDAVIHIDDDGLGIADVDRERVFEPFFRSHSALRDRLPGHGLGLALIRHIAQTHGGSAYFVEKSGRGARLEIRLPVAQLRPRADQPTGCRRPARA